MHFSEPQLNTLLRLLKHNTERERRRFFVLMIGCRRRLQLKFENTPVVKLFSISDEWALLKQRALSSFVRERLSQKGTAYGDAFTFIRGASPIIKAQHMLGAFAWLGDSSMTPREMVDFIRANDKDKDGGLNFDEFLAMVNSQASHPRLNLNFTQPSPKPHLKLTQTSPNRDLILTSPYLAARWKRRRGMMMLKRLRHLR